MSYRSRLRRLLFVIHFCLLHKKKIKKAKNKKKLKKILKFSILKEEPKRSQKGAEPESGRGEAVKHMIRKKKMKNGGEHNGDFNEEI